MDDKTRYQLEKANLLKQLKELVGPEATLNDKKEVAEYMKRLLSDVTEDWINEEVGRV